jgi:hypothetical protein
VAKLVVVSRKLAMGPAWAAWSVLRGLALELLFGVLKLVSVWWSVAKLVVVSRRLAMGLAAGLACLQLRSRGAGRVCGPASSWWIGDD